MAARTGVNSAVGTLGAGAADTYTLTGRWRVFELVHLGDVTNPVYYRTDGVAAVAGAAETRVLKSGERLQLLASPTGAVPSISVISAGAASVMLEGVG